MSYSRSKSLTGTEKKLQSLRAQLYGKKEQPLSKSQTSGSSSFSFKSKGQGHDTHPGTAHFAGDTGYLRKDLIKISWLTTVVLGIQLILYFGLKSYIS